MLCVDRIGERARETMAMIAAEGGTAHAFEADITKAGAIPSFSDYGPNYGGKVPSIANLAGKKIMIIPGVSALAALFMRDLRLAVRVGGGALMGVLFFLIVVTLVPFAVGPDPNLLARIGLIGNCHVPFLSG